MTRFEAACDLICKSDIARTLTAAGLPLDVNMQHAISDAETAYDIATFDDQLAAIPVVVVDIPAQPVARKPARQLAPLPGRKYADA